MAQTSYADSLTAAYAGMLADDGPNDIISRVSAEASAEMPFGVGVVLGVTDPACLLPVDATSKAIGIVVHSHAYPSTALGTTGVKTGNMINVLRRGRIWVTAENGCVPGDRLYIRHTAGAGGSQKGAIRNGAVGVELLDATTQGVFLTTAAAGGLAVLEVDFTAKPA